MLNKVVILFTVGDDIGDGLLAGEVLFGLGRFLWLGLGEFELFEF